MRKQNRYTYNNVTYNRMIYRYRHFEVSYTLSYENKKHVIAIDTDVDDVIIVEERRKEDALVAFKKWFQENVNNGQVRQLIRKGYAIYPAFEDVLKNTRKHGVAYHVTWKRNLPSIMENGLLANGEEDFEVLIPSRMMDTLKPKWIPESVKRSESIYFHPEFTNSMVREYGHDMVLLAIKHIPATSWVASQGIGGFCVMWEDLVKDPQERIKHLHDVESEFGPLYWRYSCSLENFKKMNSREKRKQRHYGLDEILVSEPIPFQEITLLGEWDENGEFAESEQFIDFVQDKWKPSYKDMLFIS